MIKYILIFFGMIACSQQDGKVNNYTYGGIDYIFLAHYQNCLEIISQYQMGNEKITDSYFSKALNCLEVITEIKDNVYRGDSMYYTSRELYYKDLEAWSHWFAENGYNFTFDQAYQKFEFYRRSNAQEVTWPPMVIDIMVK